MPDQAGGAPARSRTPERLRLCPAADAEASPPGCHRPPRTQPETHFCGPSLQLPTARTEEDEILPMPSSSLHPPEALYPGPGPGPAEGSLEEVGGPGLLCTALLSGLTHAAPAGAPKGKKNAKNVNASPGAGPSRWGAHRGEVPTDNAAWHCPFPVRCGGKNTRPQITGSLQLLETKQPSPCSGPVKEGAQPRALKASAQGRPTPSLPHSEVRPERQSEAAQDLTKPPNNAFGSPARVTVGLQPAADGSFAGMGSVLQLKNKSAPGKPPAPEDPAAFRPSTPSSAPRSRTLAPRPGAPGRGLSPPAPPPSRPRTRGTRRLQPGPPPRERKRGSAGAPAARPRQGEGRARGACSPSHPPGLAGPARGRRTSTAPPPPRGRHSRAAAEPGRAAPLPAPGPFPRSGAGAPLPGRGGRLSPRAAARGLIPSPSPARQPAAFKSPGYSAGGESMRAGAARRGRGEAGRSRDRDGQPPRGSQTIIT
ncbi:basic proline-rich protein-like [Dama dama]|uniref:basic proline-rich protein-like n=1 Tax=Dama dama TaxID=30532 RepID=UPI002A35A365|nr:basic proline-rich protein-like [Dama dama]